MSQIDELQGRITQALERIARGVDAIEAAPAVAEAPPEPEPVEDTGPSEEMLAIQEALEEERLANAQLQARLSSLHDQHADELAGLQEQMAAQREGLAGIDAEMQRLRQANDGLIASNEALREANAKGVGEPHLINKAMLAELEGIRAARAAEVAETKLLLDTLGPLLEQAANDAGELAGQDEQEGMG